jgi:hypothetical protein
MSGIVCLLVFILHIRCTEVYFVTFLEGIIACHNFYVKLCTVGTDISTVGTDICIVGTDICTVGINICTVDVVISSYNCICCNCVSGCC